MNEEEHTLVAWNKSRVEVQHSRFDVWFLGKETRRDALGTVGNVFEWQQRQADMAVRTEQVELRLGVFSFEYGYGVDVSTHEIRGMTGDGAVKVLRIVRIRQRIIVQGASGSIEVKKGKKDAWEQW